MFDEIDRAVLTCVGRNARISSRELQKVVRDIGREITERAIRYRLQRMERNNIIIGYSVILNPSRVSEKIKRTIILKFNHSSNSSAPIERLSNYVEEAK